LTYLNPFITHRALKKPSRFILYTYLPFKTLWFRGTEDLLIGLKVPVLCRDWSSFFIMVCHRLLSGRCIASV
jgi:hypothetical protein